MPAGRGGTPLQAVGADNAQPYKMSAPTTNELGKLSKWFDKGSDNKGDYMLYYPKVCRLAMG